MATGVQTYEGMAVPLFGESVIVQTTAATDILTIQQKTTGSGGNFLTVQNASGTQLLGISNLGNVNLRRYTTKPTTGLTKGDLYLMFHGSRPMLCVCTSTATSAAKLIRLRTKTNGRLTA